MQRHAYDFPYVVQTFESPLCAHGEYSEYLDSTFQTGLLGQAEKADGSVGLVRSPGCYSTVG